MTTRDADFEAQRDGIRVALWNARQCLENCRELDCAIHSGKSGVRRYYHFLLYTESVFYRSFINHTINAIHKDRRRKSNSLGRLCEYVQSHPSLPKNLNELLQELWRLLQDGVYRDTIKKMRTERDKVISHNELTMYGFHPSVSYAEGSQLVEKLIVAFDAISIEYDGTGHLYDLPILHANSMLSDLDRRADEN